MPKKPCTYFSHCFLFIEVTQLLMYKSTMIFFLSLGLKTITSLKYSWSMCWYYFMMCFHTLVNSFLIQPSNTFPSHNSPIHLTSFKMSNFLKIYFLLALRNLNVPIFLGSCHQSFPLPRIPWQVAFPYLPS